MKDEAIEKLKDLGLNQVEAEVYHLLLSEKPMTAYRVGKLLHKPTANIYKAMDVLQQKGAVIVEEGKNKLCRAVNPAEFIAVQENEFAQKAAHAAKALRNIAPRQGEEGTFSLDSVALAMEKVRQMIEKAQVVVMVDAFPLALEMIKPLLIAAVQRGVRVDLQAYTEVDIEGVDTIVIPGNEEVISYWQTQQLNVAADGKESLVALFDKSIKEVFHATWNTNVYLSCVIHAGLTCEQSLHKLLAIPESPDQLEEIKKVLQAQKFLRNSNVPGVQTLLERHLKAPNNSHE